MNKKLKKAVRQQKKNTKQEVQQLTGLLGLPLDGKRVEVPGRNAYVYVRLRSNQSEVIQAYNNQVAPSYNLPVIVERQGNRYIVVGVDSQRYDNNWNSSSPFLPKHGTTHSFDPAGIGGGDIVWVYSRQMMPMLALPSGTLGSPNVVIAPYTLRKENGNWIYVGNTGTQSFAPYRPSSPTGAIMGLIYLDSEDGNPKFIINSGTVFPNSLTGTNQIVPYIPSLSSPSTQIPLAAVRLITGTSQISWDSLYDVRQWLHTVPTGTGGGGGVSTVITGTSVQDEGIPLGVVGTFDFVGSGVDVSVSGTVARVHVTGSTGGGIANLTGTSIGLPNTLGLTNSSGHLTTEPWIRWGTNFVEMGANKNKESNAGKFGYELFSSGYMEWVGAGTGTPRWHRFYDNTKTGLSQVDNLQVLTLPNSWIYLNGTGTAAGPINAPQKTFVTGSDYVLGINGTDNSSVKVLVTDLAEAIIAQETIGTFLDSVQVPASTVYHSCPWKPTANAATNNVSWGTGGVITNLVFRKNGTQPASGDLIVTLVVNGSNTALTVTVPAGSAGATTHEDNTHAVTISAGDTLRWSFNNAATAAGAAMTAISMVLSKRSTA